MKKKSLFRWICLAVLITLFTGCTKTAPQPTQSPLISPLDTSASQAASPVSSPIPGLPGWNDTPLSGKSTIRGYIKITQPTILLGELFLAKAVATSDPNISLLELDEKASPRAIINRDTNQFIFTDIEPGKYGLIVWEPMNSFPVNAPETQQTLFFEVKANEITDVGVISIP